MGILRAKTGLVSSLAVAFFLVFLSAASTVAADSVESGFYEFESVDGGTMECRVKDWVVPCEIIPGVPDILGINPWASTLPVPGFLTTSLEGFPYQAIRTVSLPNSMIVGAVFTNVAHLNPAAYLQFGIPHYATSWLFKDIELADPSGEGGLVEVQISADYDWEGGLTGYLAYDARFGIGMEVKDITDSVMIAGSSFVEMDRAGDQGVTDIAFGSAAYDGNGDVNHISVLLERGRSYRIFFKVQAYGAPLASAITSEVRARLNSLTVSIPFDEDEQIKQAISDLGDQLELHDLDIKDQLDQHDLDVKSQVDQHDQDIKSAIGIHDTDLKVQLGQHDTDIKARLDEIEAKIDVLTERQLEVIRLLHTPEGQRQTDVPACGGEPCDWADKTKK